MKKKRSLHEIEKDITKLSNKQRKGSVIGSVFDKLPNELMMNIFKWFDPARKMENPLFPIDSFYDYYEVGDNTEEALRFRNAIRLTCKRFLENDEVAYRAKLNELLRTRYQKPDHELRTYRQIFFDLEVTIRNHAMSLLGEKLLWSSWAKTLENEDIDGGKNVKRSLCYQFISDYWRDFNPEVGRTVVLKYLIEHKFPSPLSGKTKFLPFFDVNTIIFDGTTLLDWMKMISDNNAVEFLKSNGANVSNEVDHNLKTENLSLSIYNIDVDKNPIYFDLEVKIRNYAMNLLGQAIIWDIWNQEIGNETKGEHHYSKEEKHACYKYIRDYWLSFPPDIERTAVLEYLIEDRFANHLPQKITFSSFNINIVIIGNTTLLDWMSAIGDVRAVKFLVAKGATVTDDCNFKALECALTGSIKYGIKFPESNSHDRIEIFHELLKVCQSDMALNSFIIALYNPYCTEKTITSILDTYDPDDSSFEPLSEIFAYLENRDSRYPHFLKNCMIALDYIQRSSNYSIWRAEYDTFGATRYRCINPSFQQQRKEAYYAHVLDYLIEYKAQHGNYPTSDEFYEVDFLKIGESNTTLPNNIYT